MTEYFEYVTFTNDDDELERRDVRDAEARVLISDLEADMGGAEDRLDDLEDVQIPRLHQQHNNLYAGRNIVTSCADAITAGNYANVWEFLKACVTAGDYSLLDIGDYAPITVGSNTYNYRIAAFDYDKGTGATEVTTGSILMVPDKTFPDGVAWKSGSNNNNGNSTSAHPYIVSTLHDYELNTLLPTFPSEVRAVMKERVALLEKRYTNGQTLTDSNGWDWVNMGRLWSLSEVEVYGQMYWSGPYANGADTQLPLFRDVRNRILRTPDNGRSNWWLRCAYAGSSTYACDVYGSGYAGNNGASSAGVRPAPCFLIG